MARVGKSEDLVSKEIKNTFAELERPPAREDPRAVGVPVPSGEGVRRVLRSVGGC